MSERISPGAFLVASETPQQCDDCGQVRELRPYGPPGKRMICFECGMKDPAGTEARFHRHLEG